MIEHSAPDFGSSGREYEVAHWKGQLFDYGRNLRKQLRGEGLDTVRETLQLKLARAATENKRSPLAKPHYLSDPEFEREINAVVDKILGEPGIAEGNVRHPFRLDDKGLWYIDKDNDGEDQSVRVCSPIEVVAATRNEDGEDWGRLIRVRDPENRWHEWAVPMEILACEGNAYLQRLVSLGLILETGPKARHRLREYLQADPHARVRAVSKLGWHQGRVFIMPDAVFGQSGSERFIFQSGADIEHSFRVRGSIESWRQQVSELCQGNSRLVLAICCAFAAPTLGLLDAEGGGCHFVGPSSIGKTTALKVAGSVWGGGGGDRGYIRTWRATTNGLEGIASIHSDSLLCLDELSEVPVKDAGDVAYMLANGQGKARARTDGSAKKPARWRVLILSSGEITLQDRIAEAGQLARGGQLVRIIDIPADPGRGLGLFEDLKGFGSGEIFSRHLKENASLHYGAPIRAFLSRLTSNLEDAKAQLRKASEAFVSGNCPEGADPQVQRACRRFALIAAAGEVATSYGITGWPVGEATHAAKRCLGDWLSRRGHLGAADVEEAISQVRKFIESHGAARFTDVASAETDRPTVNRAGFKKTTKDDQTEYLVLPEVFRKEVCKGFDIGSVCRELARRGMLIPGTNGKSTIVCRIHTLGSKRLYCLTSKILEEGAENSDESERSDDGDAVTGVTEGDVTF